MDDNKTIFELISDYRGVIMGYAAISILAFHEWYLTPTGIPFLDDFFGFMITSGDVGVDIFMILSGFGIVFALYKKPKLKDFYLKRIERILPTFVLLTAVFAIIKKWSFLKFIQALFGYGMYKYNEITYEWYSLAIILMYLVSPLIFKLFKTNKHYFLTGIIFVILWYIVTFFAKNYINSVYYIFLNRVPTYVIGMVMGFCVKEKQKVKYKWLPWAISIALIIIGYNLSYLSFFYGLYLGFPSPQTFLPYLTFSLGIVLFIPLLLNAMSKVKALGIVEKIINKVLSFEGKISYELYMFQTVFGVLVLYPLARIPRPFKEVAILIVLSAGAFVLNLFWNKLFGIIHKKANNTEIKDVKTNS